MTSLSTLFAVIVQFLASFFFIWMLSVRHLHIFQLNGYRMGHQIKWYLKNPAIFLYSLAALLSLLFLFLNPASYIAARVAASFVIIIVALIAFAQMKNAKTPIVYTPRVKRLLSTSMVIYTLVGGFYIFDFIFGRKIIVNGTKFFIKDFIGNEAMLDPIIYFAALSFILVPLITFVANIINMPFEKAINRYYIKDAKKMLSEAPDLKVIGVTGSYGKTSTKHYIAALLREKYDVLMTPQSYNTPLGIVKTVRSNLRSTDDFFVCEMGARKLGEIKEICDIVKPAHGVVTAIGEQHLETFKSLDNVKKTKFELVDAIDNTGYVFLNIDDENISSILPKRKYISYGTKENADYRAVNIKYNSEGATFDVVAKNGEKESFDTKILGKENIINIVGAIAVANTFEVPLADMRRAVRRMKPAAHRLNLIQKNDFTLLDDSYNSNPVGSKMALDTLASFDGYKILVTPGMVELGKKSDEYNLEFGRYAAKTCDKVVLVKGRNSNTKAIYKGLVDAGFNPNNIAIVETVYSAINYIASIKKENKVVLLENDLPDNF